MTFSVLRVAVRVPNGRASAGGVQRPGQVQLPGGVHAVSGLGWEAGWRCREVSVRSLVACCYLLEHEDQYAGFVEGGRGVRAYCKDDIEPMSKECDHLCISALTEALGEQPLPRAALNAGRFRQTWPCA